ncbi:Parg, partial [Symbiodinium natans]
ASLGTGVKPGGNDTLLLAFTHDDAANSNRSKTVASIQSVTAEHVIVFFTAKAYQLTKAAPSQHNMALSRRTKTLTIVDDGSAEFQMWVKSLRPTENFALVTDTRIEAPRGPAASVVPDPDFLRLTEPPVQKVVQPGSDSRLTTCLVKDGDVEAQLNVGNFLDPFNQRGHPADFSREFYTAENRVRKRALS